MVGHTGKIPAVVAAVEATDRCLGRVVACVEARGRRVFGHRRPRQRRVMLEPDGVSPHTAHTTNPVPLVVTDAELALRDGGELSDLAPTVLALLGLAVPADMTGNR